MLFIHFVHYKQGDEMTLYTIGNRQTVYLHTVYNVSIKWYIYALYTLQENKIKRCRDGMLRSFYIFRGIFNIIFLFLYFFRVNQLDLI